MHNSAGKFVSPAFCLANQGWDSKNPPVGGQQVGFKLGGFRALSEWGFCFLFHYTF